MKGIVEFLYEAIVTKFQSITVPMNSSDSVKKLVLKKAIKDYPELDPNGFSWTRNVLNHNGKTKKAASKKNSGVDVAKPEGMSDMEYLKTIVTKNNTRFNTAWEKIDGSKIEWKPLEISHASSEEEKEEFADRYFISNIGDIAISNPTSAKKCHLCIPYYDKSTKRYLINLRTYDFEGKETSHKCLAIRSLVRNVFGDDAAQAIIDKEKEMKNKNAETEQDISV